MGIGFSLPDWDFPTCERFENVLPKKKCRLKTSRGTEVVNFPKMVRAAQHSADRHTHKARSYSTHPPTSSSGSVALLSSLSSFSCFAIAAIAGGTTAKKAGAGGKGTWGTHLDDTVRIPGLLSPLFL